MRCANQRDVVLAVVICCYRGFAGRTASWERDTGAHGRAATRRGLCRLSPPKLSNNAASSRCMLILLARYKNFIDLHQCAVFSIDINMNLDIQVLGYDDSFLLFYTYSVGAIT